MSFLNPPPPAPTQVYDPHLSGFLRLSHVPFLLRTLKPPFDLLNAVRQPPSRTTFSPVLPHPTHSSLIISHPSTPLPHLQPSAARERRHVLLRVTGGTTVYFGDLLMALLAAVYDVNVRELPPQVAARVQRATDAQRRRIVALFNRGRGGESGGALAPAEQQPGASPRHLEVHQQTVRDLQALGHTVVEHSVIELLATLQIQTAARAFLRRKRAALAAGEPWPPNGGADADADADAAAPHPGLLHRAPSSSRPRANAAAGSGSARESPLRGGSSTGGGRGTPSEPATPSANLAPIFGTALSPSRILERIESAEKEEAAAGLATPPVTPHVPDDAEGGPSAGGGSPFGRGARGDGVPSPSQRQPAAEGASSLPFPDLRVSLYVASELGADSDDGPGSAHLKASGMKPIPRMMASFGAGSVGRGGGGSSSARSSSGVGGGGGSSDERQERLS